MDLHGTGRKTQTAAGSVPEERTATKSRSSSGTNSAVLAPITVATCAARTYPFGVAAIYDYWKNPTDDWITSFSLLTVNADNHPVMGRFHAPGDEKRSIVAIDPPFLDDWLKATTDEALSFFTPVAAASFTTLPDPKATKAK